MGLLGVLENRKLDFHLLDELLDVGEVILGVAHDTDPFDSARRKAFAEFLKPPGVELGHRAVTTQKRIDPQLRIGIPSDGELVDGDRLRGCGQGPGREVFEGASDRANRKDDREKLARPSRSGTKRTPQRMTENRISNRRRVVHSESHTEFVQEDAVVKVY